MLREFTTKRISEITNALNSIQGSLVKADKRLDHPIDLKERMASLDKEVIALKNIVAKSVSDDVSLWMESHQIQKLDFTPENIAKVVDDYFTGSGVFKSQKSREDFPDSMIHQTICDLVANVGEVHAILIDGAFKKGIAKQEGVKVLDSIQAFLEITDIADYLSNEPFKQLFTSPEVAEQLRLYFAHQKEQISHIYVTNDAVSNLEIIGIDAYNAIINWPDEDSIRDIVISNFYTASDNEFTAEISFVTDTSVHYISDYGSYLQIEKDANRSIDLDSMDGDGICDLYESFIAEFSGRIHFSFSEPQSLEGATAIMKSIIENEALVSIDLEIEAAKLLDIIA